ncbi:MAG: RIP metalloprotease RseP [Candidatus Krumholzibacteria bacterium]|nr:RIP metalloprotease RseP [Candidatus Krumholzibacteria bacterium]
MSINFLIISLFAFLVTLGLVVIVHELGHFLFCKLFGIYVKTFSIGIGPKFLRKRWGETEYVLSAIPFGGYVKMAGEGIMEEIQDTGTWEERKYPLGTEEGNAEAAGINDHIPPDRFLISRPAWQRLFVFIAGPLFNLVLAFVLYTGVVLSTGLVNYPFTTVGDVQVDSPAAAAGIQVGDKILKVGGLPMGNWGDIIDGLTPVELQETGPSSLVSLEVLREGRTMALELQPMFDEESGYWSTGLESWNTTVGRVKRNGPAAKLGLRKGDVIESVNGETVTSFSKIAGIINDRPGQEIEIIWVRDGEWMNGIVVPELKEIRPGVKKGRIFYEPYFIYEKVGLGSAIVFGYKGTLNTISQTVRGLRDLILGKHGLEAVGGPLRIGQVAGEMLSWSFAHLMSFIAFFSINLFLLNLMPIPVLDGGHVLFLLLEVIRGGKPVPERLQAIATQIGLIILLLFMTFVVVLDFWTVTGH